jgi:anti-anti-sigma regulatory factor
MAVVTPPSGVDDRFSRDDSRIEVVIDRAQTGEYAAIVALHGEHDVATGEAIRDLTSCEFIDSTIMSLLLRKARSLERDGHPLVIRVTPDSTVARTLLVSGVDHSLTIRVV